MKLNRVMFRRRERRRRRVTKSEEQQTINENKRQTIHYDGVIEETMAGDKLRNGDDEQNPHRETTEAIFERRHWKTLQRGTTEGGIRGCDVADTLHDTINRGRGNEAAGRSTINRSEEVLNCFVTTKDVCTAGAKRLEHNAHTRTIGVVTPSI